MESTQITRSKNLKKSISILLAILILLLSVKDLLLVASFQLFQDEIAEKWCINKYEPGLMCHGQCFLDQQIAENYTESGTAGQFLNARLTLSLFYYHDAAPQVVSIFKSIEDSQLNYFYLGLQNDLFIHSIFHPPQPRESYVG